MEIEILNSQIQILQQPPYDPEQYQSLFKFTVGGLESFEKSYIRQDETYFIETDISFVQSIKQVCWYHFGIRKDKFQNIKDGTLETLQQKTIMYAQTRTINEPELLCQNLLEVTHLTYDNVFFFFFIKVLFLNSIIMILGFSIPAMVKYGQNDYYTLNPLYGCSSKLCDFVNQYSSYNSKNPNQTFNLIQWTGFGSLIILQIVFFIAWKINKQVRQAILYEQVVNENVALLKNLPPKQYNERQLIEFLQKKFHSQSLKNQKQASKRDNPNSDSILKPNLQKSVKNNFRIKAVQILYDFRTVKVLINQIKQLSKMCLQLIRQQQKNGHKIYQITNQYLYKDYKLSIKNKNNLIQQWRNDFIYKQQFRRKLSLDSAFIHFESLQDKKRFINFFQKIYPIAWIMAWGTPEEVVQIQKSKHTQEQSIGLLNNFKLKVGLAPQPENIVWQNVQLTFDQWRSYNYGCRILTFIIPLLHFGILLGLQFIKTYYVKQNTNVIVGYVISVGSVLANVLFMPLMDLTLDKQNQRLVTSKQVQKNYIGFASQSLSIIVAPLITNYAILGNYYGQRGVIGTAFEYQLTSLVTIPFLMLYSPIQLIQKISNKINCIRNWRFRRQYLKQEAMRQKTIYEFFIIPQFEISSTYAFMMTNFLHVTCFCTALPIIIFIFAAQLIVLYWVSKYRLVKLCKYPKLIRRWLMGIVFASLVVSPLFFIAGFLINLKAFTDIRGTINHSPIALYVYLGIWAPLSALLVILDKKLQKTQLFSWFIPKGIKAQIKDIETKRKKNYPSKSTSYFVDNNAIPVLGFEKWILGSIRNAEGEYRLKNLCENEVEKVYRNGGTKLGNRSQV